MSRAGKAVVVAWLITAIYYFYQYALRSAPAVMMPELSKYLRHQDSLQVLTVGCLSPPVISTSYAWLRLK